MPLNRGYSYRQQIGAGADGTTSLEFLAGAFRHSTIEAWAERIERGEVELDGRVCSTEQRLRRGSWLIWHRPPWNEPAVDGSFRIAFEDKDLLVVDKPAGLPTLPAGGFLTQTLLYKVRRTHPQATPAHRLGRYTSGLLVFSRNRDAGRRLAAAFRESRVERIYRGLASGSPRQESFRVDARIGRIPYGPLGRLHAADPQGASAATSVRKVGNRGSDAFLADIEIHTGRPHQIRIHLAYAGHPLEGDPLYGPGGVPLPGTTAVPGDGGYLLHAMRLSFPHPSSGAQVRFESTPEGALRSLTDV